jgi:O-antigen/teichoic acid export membrane protein
MEESNMKKHVTLVAALQIGFSTMGLIAAMIVFFVFSFAGSFVADVDVASEVMRFLGTFLPAIIVLASILGLIGGIGLLGYYRWARVLVMVIAALGCLNFPLGTLKGVYSLWVLMQDEAIALFK